MSSNVYARYPRNGRTARELAELAGKSVRTAQRWTSEPREQYEARTAARHNRISELRAEGLSYRAIATELGVSISTVHYALNKETEHRGSHT